MAYIGNQPSSVTNIKNADIASDAAIEISKLDNVTATNTDLNVLQGAAAAGVSASEIQHLNGVTSNIQTQINAAAGAATKGTLTKSFVTGETSVIALSTASTPTASVFVTKEISQTGVSNGDWNVNANDTGYDIEDFAYAEDLSINTTDRTATLASSPWAADDVGKRIVGGGGVATLLDTSGNLEISTAFDTSNPTLTSGTWNFYGVVLGATGVSLNRADGKSTVAFDTSDSFVTDTDQDFNYDTTIASMTERKVRMSPDGTTLFLLNTSGQLYWMSLNTPYDITTYSGSASSFNPGQMTTVHDFVFSPDGTKMVMLNSLENVYYYTLSTAFDPSSSTYVSTFDLSTIMTDAVSIAFTEDGETMYALDNNDKRVYQYGLSTAWDVSTATYSAKSGYVGAIDTTASPAQGWSDVFFIELNPTTSRLYVSTSGNVLDTTYAYIRTFKFNVLEDIGTLEYTGEVLTHPYNIASLGSFTFIENGFGLLCGNGTTLVTKYTLSKPYDIKASSHSFSDLNSNIITQASTRHTFGNAFSSRYAAMSPNGEMLVVIVYDTSLDDVRGYLFTLETPYDPNSTWTYRSFVTIATSDTAGPGGIAWSQDNLTYITTTRGNYQLYQISVNPSTYAQSITTTISSNNAASAYLTGAYGFSNDGSKLWIVPGYAYGGTIAQYNLSTPYRISGITLLSPNYTTLITGITNLAESLTTYVTATSRYGLGMNVLNDTEVLINLAQGGMAKLTLTTANDISTATLAKFTDASSYPRFYSTALKDNFQFTPDGKSVISASSNNIYRTSLPAAYDVFNNAGTSHTLKRLPNQAAEASTINADETKAYQYEASTGLITEITLGTLPFPHVNAANTASTFTATTHETSPTDILFNGDGSKLFVVGNGTDSIYSYSVPTAFDISTATTSGYTSYAFTEDTDVQSAFFNGDGTKMYMVGNANKTIYQYSLSSAYDISSVTYDTVSLDVDVLPETLTNIFAAAFDVDGTKLFVSGYTSNNFNFIAQFDLPTAYSLTGATLNNFSPQQEVKSLTFNSDGTRYYGNVYIHSAERNITNASVTPTSQNLAAITNSVNQIDTEYWTDINSMSALSTASNSGNVYFAVSTDNQVTFKVADNSNGKRSIVRNNAGTWEYNSNATYVSETWTAASTNSKFKAFDEAIDIAANQMDATQLAAVSDFNHFVLGDTLDLAIILNQTGVGTPAISDGVTINYDAQALNKGAILGTDYDYDVPTSTSVRITSLKDQNLKVKVV